ncbi:MAG TPA: hydrogenase maturation protease, partial [Caldisericia bacterium]|nr:hydrogenase maturation protease [Caldisericia bacterium]
MNTLVVGLGNTLLGDEGVGVHIVNVLKDQPLPPSVVLKDGGVSGFDILPDILESDRVVIIDAAKMG